MSDMLPPQEAYNRCEDQLERARIMLNTYRDGDNTLQLVNAIRRVSWGVAALNDTIRALNERITTLNQKFTTLAADVEELTGDDFGDGLPF